MAFYRNGNSCDTTIAAVKIVSCRRYRRLFRFGGGFLDWRDKDYPYVIE